MVPHPPGSVSAILDTIKQHFSPPKPVQPEPVSPPAQVSVPVAEWNKLMEMVKLVQTSKGASPGTPEESDAEKLWAIAAGTPGNVTVDVTPKRSVGSLQGTRLQFSETSTSNFDSSDEESYCSAASGNKISHIDAKGSLLISGVVLMILLRIFQRACIMMVKVTGKLSGRNLSSVPLHWSGLLMNVLPL